MNYLTVLNRPFTYALLCFLLFSACNDEPTTSTEMEAVSVVEVTALHNHAENLHQFDMSTHEVPSGWTTFQLENLSHADHFIVIYRVPDEAIEAADAAGEPLLDHWFQGVTEPFQTEFNPYINGEIDYGEFVDNLVGSILEKGPWFFDPGATPMGGPGFTAIGNTSETTINLLPGEYVVECYVKDENEEFHSYLGMLEQLTVTDSKSEVEEPESTASLSISSGEGIQLDQNLEPGDHTIAIIFEDQDTYAHLLGHNVQLVKLNDKNDDELVNNLSEWMDWTQPGGLVDEAPAGAEFIGGAMEMTPGARAFFHVELEPGDYAWIAEIPNPADNGMLKKFTVTN